MKKLFCVKDCHNNVVTSLITNQRYFSDKQAAKEWRDVLNEKGGKGCPHTVADGPDHIGKHGQKAVGIFRRQPKS